MRTMQLLYSGVTAGVGMASLLVPRSCKVVAVDWNSYATFGNANQGIIYCVSKLNSAWFATNDAPDGAISYFSINQSFFTAVGVAHALTSKAVTGIEYPVEAGEKLYIHVATPIAAPASALVLCLLHVTL